MSESWVTSVINTTYQTVVCAPIYTNRHGLPTEVHVDEGLKYDSAIRCDELVSLEKSKLTNFISSLSEEKITELNQALEAVFKLERLSEKAKLSTIN